MGCWNLRGTEETISKPAHLKKFEVAPSGVAISFGTRCSTLQKEGITVNKKVKATLIDFVVIVSLVVAIAKILVAEGSELVVFLQHVSNIH